uniref:Uncharacterized protein n=2 Tax=Sphaerodactylus townsendi TaxID=933632 RepID=A0ACB8F889_9SAUR
MFAARLVCLRALPSRSLRPALTPISPAWRSSALKTNLSLSQPYQGYATRARMGLRRGKTGQEMKEAAFEPAMEKVFKVDQMGRWLVAGGAVVGLGALCYYGLGLSSEIGAIDKAV